GLRSDGLLERGDWKPFYLRLSEILREYLGARFDAGALEQTTTELLASLRGAGLLAPDLERIALWCQGCDLVKFAKHVPTLTEAQGHFESAYQIVDATRLREPAVELSPDVETRISA